MENQTVISTDYCPDCGSPLLFPNKPCPNCASNNKNSNMYIQRSYLNDYVTAKEKVYFGIALIFSILSYLILTLSIIGIPYLIGLMFLCLISQGMFIGSIRGNAIKVNESQFPEIYNIAQNLSMKHGLNRLPDIYIMQAGGALNALASKFLGRNFVVIYSDILELAYEKGQDAVEFILSHELTHVKRNHIGKNMLILPGLLMPFLGSAYSRACEYTCDTAAALTSPNGAIDGLLVLTAGKKLYSLVNLDEFIIQAKKESGFWSWFSEIFETHPHLYKRIINIRKFYKN